MNAAAHTTMDSFGFFTWHAYMSRLTSPKGLGVQEGGSAHGGPIPSKLGSIA